MALITIGEELQEEIEQEITLRLEAIREDVLDRYAELTGRPRTLHSLHGSIGSKNNTYVDAIRTQFLDFKDFQARWLNGLLSDAREKDRRSLDRYGRTYISSAHKMIRLLQDTLVREYALLFLERNFYRNHLERTRAKPDSTLWQLWFGDNKMTWGLIIAPALRNKAWANDRSAIRRARYHYWTVGHVLATGLVDPTESAPFAFADMGQLFAFYKSILKRVSNSAYERAIADRYIAYIESSREPLDEPFLIPELRYAGLEGDHKYRLDYTVLNAHTMRYVGFELSPHSTHYALSGIRTKTQVQINRELAERWADEMQKRNEYFETFGIQTVTFTDRELVDLDKCFSCVASHLAERPPERPDLGRELDELDKFRIEDV